MLPLRTESVVAGLGKVSDERRRGRLGFALVVVVGDPLNRECLRAWNVAVRIEHALGKQRSRGDGLHRRARCDSCSECEVVEAGVIRDGQDLAGRWLDDDHRAVVMLADGRLGSPLGCCVDRCGESSDVPGRDDDCLGVDEGLACRALDLDVQARGSVARGRACLQARGDVVQPRVAVTGEIVAAGVVDRGNARSDRDGSKVRGRR